MSLNPLVRAGKQRRTFSKVWCDAQSAEGARRLLLKRSSYKTPEMIASSNAAAARLILEKHPRFAGLQRVSRVHPTTTWMQAYRRARTMASADASASPVQFLNEVALLRVVVSTLIDSLDLRADAPRGWGGLELEVLRYCRRRLHAMVAVSPGAVVIIAFATACRALTQLESAVPSSSSSAEARVSLGMLREERRLLAALRNAGDDVLYVSHTTLDEVDELLLWCNFDLAETTARVGAGAPGTVDGEVISAITSGCFILDSLVPSHRAAVLHNERYAAAFARIDAVTAAAQASIAARKERREVVAAEGERGRAWFAMQLAAPSYTRLAAAQAAFCRNQDARAEAAFVIRTSRDDPGRTPPLLLPISYWHSGGEAERTTKVCVGINSTFWTRQQLAEARQKAEFAAAREQALLEEAIEQQVWLVEQLNGVRAEIAAVRDDDTSPPLSPYSRLYRENDVAPRREIFVVAEPPPPLSAWNGGVSTMPRATAPPIERVSFASGGRRRRRRKT